MNDETQAVEAEPVEPADQIEPVEEIAEGKEPEPTKTYSQEEVDRIVNKSKKNAAYRAKRETEQYYKGLHKGQESIQKPEPKPEPDKAPNRNDFDNYEDYIRADARYNAKQEATQIMDNREKENEVKKSNESHQKVVGDFQANLHEKFPDINERMEALKDVEMPNGMAYAIAESEYGPEILNHLVDHPDEFTRITALPATSAIKEVGKLEVQLTPAAKQTQQPTKAPEPLNPVKKSSTLIPGEPDPNKNDGKDWLKWRENQLRKQA